MKKLLKWMLPLLMTAMLLSPEAVAGDGTESEAGGTEQGYTVTYEADGGTIYGVLLTSYSADTEPLSYLLPRAYRDGFRFEGWTLDGEPVELLPIPDRYEDYTLQANWSMASYCLLLDLNGGTAAAGSALPPESFTIVEVETIRQYPLPRLEKEGFCFEGWDVLIEETEEHVIIDGEGPLELPLICCDMQATAIFRPEKQAADVLLDTLSGEPLGSLQAAAGSMVTLDMLTALLPEGTAYAGVIDENLEPFAPFTAEEGMTYRFLLVSEADYATVELIAADGAERVAAELSGGGRQLRGWAAVTASTLAGYDFVGWYAPDDTEQEACLCETPTFRFALETDVTLVARYTPKTFTVTIDGAYLIDGEAGGGTERVRSGSTLTVTAANPDTFIRWKGADQVTLGTEAELTVTVTHDLQLSLVSMEGFTTTVLFVGPSGQVIETRQYNEGELVQAFPDGPSKMGCSFRCWSTDGVVKATIGVVQALVGRGNVVVLHALYDRLPEKCQVSVFVDGEEDPGLSVPQFPVGEVMDVTAPELEGRRFVCWASDCDGKEVLSYEERYQLRVSVDIALFAVYAESGGAAVEALPVVAIASAYSETAGGRNKIAVVSVRSVPEEYEVVEQGVLFYMDGTEGTAGDMTLDDPDVRKSVGASKERVGDLTLHFNMTGKERVNICVRGYVTVSDLRTGKLMTCYSEILSASYNGLRH